MMSRFEILRAQPGERRFNRRLARQLLGIGVPMGLQFSITAIGSIMLQSANNALGTACVAAFTAAMRIKMFFMCPLESSASPWLPTAARTTVQAVPSVFGRACGPARY